MNRSLKFHPNSRQIIVLVLLALAVYVLIPQFGDFRSSWQIVRHPVNPVYVYAAIALTFLTYPIAALTYRFLAFHKIPLGRTTLIQIAAMFANRLLPAGIGALGVNYLYLRRERHQPAQAASAVGVNNIMGLAGHSLLTAAGLLFFADRLNVPDIPLTSQIKTQIFIAAIFLLLAAGIIWLARVNRNRLKQALLSFRKELLQYRRRLQALVSALFTSMTLTICNVLSFTACLLSLDIHLPFITVFIIFSVGVVAAISTPTPGGLGGFEAGLAAGLLANDIAPASALAAALLYRLISFWLPLLAGAPAIVVCQRRKLLERGATR